LPTPAVELLHAVRAQRPADLPDDALLFRDPRIAEFDWRFSPKRVSKRFSEWCERHPTLRIRGRVPSAQHLRHTYVSHASMAGASPSVLADQIGHSETEMQRQYSDILLNAKRALAAQFEARLRGAKP
jgi:integrase